MAEGRYWGGQLSIHPHEAMMQQGLSWTASHRKAALADDAVQRYLFDVGSVFHAHLDVTVKGDCWIDLYEVTSYTVGAGSSLTVMNRNTEFTDVNTFSTLLFETPSLEAGSLGLYQGIAPGGEKASGAGGQFSADTIHFHAGIYVLDVTNKAGAATDLSMTVTWEEQHKD